MFNACDRATVVAVVQTLDRHASDDTTGYDILNDASLVLVGGEPFWFRLKWCLRLTRGMFT